ncbi:MAG: hypothetical protein LBH59_00580 [Planctomycetaceae bacterium]|jgi:hypothetical protein|nr:hypothetical protein [Planctomycetaceae bacterium]
MDKFSQHKLKSPATTSEHAIRKAEFDKTIGELSELRTKDNANLVTAINEIHNSLDTLKTDYNELSFCMDILFCVIINSLILLFF